MVRLKEQSRRFLNPTIRMHLHNLMIAMRTANANRRAMPDFLVIGSMKCGTTSLFHYLVQHPQVITSISKEIHYYSLHYARGEHWYRAHYPLRTALQRRHAITGEATPYYIFHPLALERTHNTVPNVKLIWLVRDPVQRTISHYFHNKRHGLEPYEFEDALDLEESRLEGEVEKMLANIRYKSDPHIDYPYKQCGEYIKQAQRNLHRFDREQVLVLRSEDFFAEPAAVLSRVFEFLRVDSSYAPRDLQARNIGTYSDADVSPRSRHALTQHFSPLNAQFADYVGRDLGWD